MVSVDRISRWIGCWNQAVTDLLVPPCCVCCDRPLEVHRRLQICEDCQKRISPSSQHACFKCGAATDFEWMTGESCTHCAHLSLPFVRTCCLGNYGGLLREQVIAMKRPGRDALALQLGQWLGQRVASKSVEGGSHPGYPAFDVIVPMPVHWLRRLRRGYNVSEVLAEGIARELRVPVRRDTLRFCRQTKKQGTLSNRQRFENMRNCLAVNHAASVAGKQILLVDDVMTSSATAGQASRTLLRSGASQICLAIVARGIGRQ